MKKIIFTLLLAMAVSVPSVKSYAQQNDGIEVSLDAEKTEILKLCKWYISTLPSDDANVIMERQIACLRFLNFASETKDIVFDVSETTSELLDLSGKNDVSNDLLGVYIAGEIIYCLEHNLNKSDAASFVFSMNEVVNSYAKLKKHPIKSLNKYLKMDKAKRREAFIKLYNKQQ